MPFALGLVCGMALMDALWAASEGSWLYVLGDAGILAAAGISVLVGRALRSD